MAVVYLRNPVQYNRSMILSPDAQNRRGCPKASNKLPLYLDLGHLFGDEMLGVRGGILALAVVFVLPGGRGKGWYHMKGAFGYMNSFSLLEKIGRAEWCEDSSI